MKIVKEFVLREIAGEAILVPTGETSQEFNGMITLSSTAQFIWENVEKVNSFDELVAKILEEFEADENTVRCDTDTFLVELLKRGIVQISDPDKKW